MGNMLCVPLLKKFIVMIEEILLHSCLLTHYMLEFLPIPCFESINNIHEQSLDYIDNDACSQEWTTDQLCTWIFSMLEQSIEC